MTRAKQRLVISGGRPAGGEMSVAARAKSFAELIAHRSDPAALAGQVAVGGHRRKEADGLVQWVLPVFAPDRAAAPSDQRMPRSLVTVERVTADASRLDELRAGARAWMVRPLVATVTGLAHGELEAESGAGEEFIAVDSDLARVLGTEVHRMLERLDLAGDLTGQVRAQRPRLERSVVEILEERHHGDAKDRIAELFDRIERGVCLARLTELADDVLARELPLLLPPGDEVVGAIVGTADLVYREGAGMVVADYKTDAVVDGAELDARVAAYRPQLELYARALEESLDLADPPWMELWFLHADRVVRLDRDPGIQDQRE